MVSDSEPVYQFGQMFSHIVFNRQKLVIEICQVGCVCEIKDSCSVALRTGVFYYLQFTMGVLSFST